MNSYMKPLRPKIPDWRHLTCTDGSIITSANRETQQAGASFFIPKSINCGQARTCKINPRRYGPTYIMNRAELAPILVALQQGHTSIATDSSSAINQIRNQIFKPMSMITHLHAQILLNIISHINSSEAP
eukprot:135195-Pelagomonas_calceolata.AAC.1